MEHLLVGMKAIKSSREAFAAVLGRPAKGRFQTRVESLLGTWKVGLFSLRVSFEVLLSLLLTYLLSPPTLNP